MSISFTEKKKIRKTFGRIEEIVALPNLIHLQRKSYEDFLQMNTPIEKRSQTGLVEVFQSIFPIRDNAGRCQLEFCRYEFECSKYDELESRQKGLTYSAPLRITFRLVVWDLDPDTKARSIKDIKEQDVFVGDVPIMTERGTFVVNGIERVIVSQVHRSPGVFFDVDSEKMSLEGKPLYVARIVPYRGSWVDIEFDPKDLLIVRIDRRKKIPLSALLMSFDSDETEKLRSQLSPNEVLRPNQITGLSSDEIFKIFYKTINYELTPQGWITNFVPEHFKGTTLTHDLVDAETGNIVAQNGAKMLPRLLKKFENDGLKKIRLQNEDLLGKYISSDMINEETGKIYVESGEEITQETLVQLNNLGIESFSVFYIDNINVGNHLLKSVMSEKIHNREEALFEIYRAIRPGEPPTLEGAEALFKSLFFDSERYDLSAVGRAKFNERLNMNVEDTVRTLRKEDFLCVIRRLLGLKDGKGEVDDIDNLGNRRVRSVGELLENQFRLGIVRMERSVRERFSGIDLETAMPHDLINAKPIAAAIREFFGTSQLSQFMDQTNPLSEITHKRRISALGPGGLSRDRAGFEVRDVHPTHYGRVCPIETPEGQNIGLINSLATYARVNKYGFIEAPYRLMKQDKVTNDIIYLSAIQEADYTIAQANIKIAEDGSILESFVPARRNGEFGIFPKEEVTLVDLSPKQMVSVAASLIPFLENDDASRALMGSNMQRQAVPLLRSEAPLIGTGMEKAVAIDSAAVVLAKRYGIVDQVDGKRIVVKALDPQKLDLCVGVDIYNLTKFQGSNMNTCINQKPLVKRGDVVTEGDVIADGPSTDLGELALGRNVLVAFMSWQGYNFEDSIVISERIARDDIFTSIHIESFEIMARDTKLGNEEITRDIPNVTEDSIRHLDEAGIVYVGAEVNPGDILVGKVTPKGETLVTPEEKLLRAIFGEKASDVKDSSLRVPPGVFGTIVDVRVLVRRGIEKDERTETIERQEIERFAKDRDAQKSILERTFLERLKERLVGQTIAKGPKSIKNNEILTFDILQQLLVSELRQIVVKEQDVMAQIDVMKKEVDEMLSKLQARFEDKVSKIQAGDELMPGILKMAKVYIAVKRKLQPGDKMAGRHGNKGVVSKVLPIEDMPFLDDGTPVDIILNPLGVPSRMNVGQILETHLGAASRELGRQLNQMLEQYHLLNLDEHVKNLDGSDIEESQEQENNQEDDKEYRAKKSRIGIKDKVLSFYEKESDKQKILSLNDDEFMELACNLRTGVPMATPVFDGAGLEDINDQLRKAGLDTTGQVTVFDGRTGEAFDRKITVGYIYILKLHHLVDDKIHARSIGPYSLVTQQPLGGKAQFGGQRFGEMEVWALEAYGAAYTLQEMLTVKSDDVIGRVKTYESIARGDEKIQTGIPESFNVLVKELRSLALNFSLEP